MSETIYNGGGGSNTKSTVPESKIKKKLYNGEFKQFATKNNVVFLSNKGITYMGTFEPENSVDGLRTVTTSMLYHFKNTQNATRITENDPNDTYYGDSLRAILDPIFSKNQNGQLGSLFDTLKKDYDGESSEREIINKIYNITPGSRPVNSGKENTVDQEMLLLREYLYSHEGICPTKLTKDAYNKFNINDQKKVILNSIIKLEKTTNQKTDMSDQTGDTSYDNFDLAPFRSDIGDENTGLMTLNDCLIYLLCYLEFSIYFPKDNNWSLTMQKIDDPVESVTIKQPSNVDRFKFFTRFRRTFLEKYERALLSSAWAKQFPLNYEVTRKAIKDLFLMVALELTAKSSSSASGSSKSASGNEGKVATGKVKNYKREILDNLKRMGWNLTPVNERGDCLFQSLGIFLKNKGIQLGFSPSADNTLMIRRMIVEYIHANWPEFSIQIGARDKCVKDGSVDQSSLKDWCMYPSKYQELMLTPREQLPAELRQARFGGHEELIAFTRLDFQGKKFQVQLLDLRDNDAIVPSNAPDVAYDESNKSNPNVVTLLYDAQNMHYSLLTPTDTPQTGDASSGATKTPTPAPVPKSSETTEVEKGVKQYVSAIYGMEQADPDKENLLTGLVMSVFS